MNINVAGFIVIGIAVVLVIMAIKGTQHGVLPQLFGDTPLSPQPYSPAQPANPNPGFPTAPKPDGTCPKGYVFARGQCVQFV